MILLDAIISHMYAVSWAEKEGVQHPKAASNTNSSIQNVEQQTASAYSTPSSTTTEIADGNNRNITQMGPLQEREKLSKDLLLLLIDTFKIITDTIYVRMLQQISDITPVNILNLIIPIVSSKNASVVDLNAVFIKLLPNADKEIITNEWPKCLEVSEDVFNTQTYPVEEYTLTVIEAHLAELTKNASYSLLNSLKHTIKSLLNLIYLVLPHCNTSNDTEINIHIEQKLQPILVAAMSDIRMEYVYEISEKCLEFLVDADVQSDTHQYLTLSHQLKYCFKLLLEYAEGMRHSTSQSHNVSLGESLLLAILNNLTQMLEKPMGVKALHNFFSVSKQGSLVELLLSFTGTTMSQMYATKLLQFIEQLFNVAERDDTHFPKHDLLQCFYELENVEVPRLKTWLSHIIYGPGSSHGVNVDTVDKALTTTITTGLSSSGVQPSSASSSNAQTPTNMATVSAIPSITDQLAQSSALDAEAMEIDDDGIVACAASSAQAQSLSLWQTAGGNSYFTNQSDASSHDENAERNGALLLSVIKHIVDDKNVPQGVSMVFFQSLLQLGQSLLAPPQETLDFTDILQIIITLADAAQGRGHATLFNAAINWLEITKTHVLDRTLVAKNQWVVKPQVALENVTSLLRYMSELLQSLGFKGSKNMTPPWEEDMQTDLEDFMDDIGAEDEDSIVEDSDEDSLGNKLCTFSQTQKEFMNQHWYHCHTCNMVNTVGVCSVCARVCHKNHDVSYAKYGNFFCDCGAKEDGSCQALSRRISSAVSTGGNTLACAVSNSSGISEGGSGSIPRGTSHAQEATSFNAAIAYATNLVATNKKRAQTPPSNIISTNIGGNRVGGGLDLQNTNDRIIYLAKLIESNREILMNGEQWSNVVRCILDFFDVLLPSIRDNCALFSIVGCHRRAKTALERLHTPEQTFQLSDQLMVPTLGSQEGAFENVRMSYSGDQGNTIKQLLSSGLVRRVALCCLSSPHGKRQHLAVSHEKGKVTILQLSALLKQADAAKRKLTLTQLSSAPIPCTVLSLTANPANEDCLAICGLKECHILTFSNSGVTNDHIVLTPQLENGNFIKKAIWLPGSQTMLALVTADYVKIYELAEDAYSPKYYFLVAVGKIRDCTFVYHDGIYYMFLIASSGYIYYQMLDDKSLAKHGDFYVTDTLELQHPHIKDINGQVGGGGVSIYYSHTLQLLFFSYSLGRSFIAPLTDVNSGVRNVMQLQTGPPTTKNSSKGPPQPLCQWTEIPGHPGLICAMMHTSNNPVIFMLMPERILMQEIKAQSSKSKIMDMVAIRHTVSCVEKTTLILLCEDGSLRIFTAQPENTNFWLSPQVQPIGNQMYSSTLCNRSNSSATSNRKSKRASGGAAGATGKANSQQKTIGPNGIPIFPIDFFEHCTMLPEVEFGGNDLLQIYNKQKLKTRLFSTGMFVASTKPTGFTLEIYNADPNTVIVGIRVLVGTQDPIRAPQSVTVLGRTIPTPVRRARWFDIPLTREEILQSDKRLNVIFGKSQDPENVCMLDSIEVYGKSKDLIGWPDESDETAAVGPGSTTGTGATGAASAAGGPLSVAAMTAVTSADGYNSITNLDKMVTTLLEVLDSALGLLGGSNVQSSIKQRAIKTATTLLLMPTPNPVQVQSKCVLATLFGNRIAYHNYKDNEVLSYVNNELQTITNKITRSDAISDIDPEAFYRLVLLVRGIATTRPQTLTKICLEHNYEIVSNLLQFAKNLYAITPKVDEPTSIVKRGLCHTEAVIHCLVEIIYAFALSDVNQVEFMTKYLIDLLLDDSNVISHSAKEAIILLLSPRVKRRKVAIVSPPVCSTPTPSNTTTAAALAAADSGLSEHSSDEMQEAAGGVVDGIAPQVRRSNSGELVDPSALDPLAHEAGQLLNIEAIMGGGFPQLLGLPQDADDEAIMDIAIALSLQQHGDDGLHSLQQGLANLQGIRNASNLQNLQALEGNNLGLAANAASVSAGGSDDEGSNAATDGSTLRTSPAEPVGSGGSESGGSGVESIGGTSGRSSTYGDQVNASPPRSSTNAQANTQQTNKSQEGAITSGSLEHSNTAVISNVRVGSTENDENLTEDENFSKLHELR